MNIDDFIASFECAVDGIPSGSLSPTTQFRDLKEWDSLAALSIIAMVNAEYGVELSASELRNSKSIENIFRAVTAKREIQ